MPSEPSSLPSSGPPAALVAAFGQLLATYTQALDDGRVDDVVATFTADATCDMPGLGTPEGHDEIRAAYASVVPTMPQRHLVSNTRIDSWGDDEATASSDVVFLLKVDDRWRVQLVGRYADTIVRTDAGWRFRRRRTVFQ